MSAQKSWHMSELAAGQSEKWIRQQYNAAIKAANDRIKTVSKAEYSGRSKAYEYYVKGDLEGSPYTKERGGATVFKALPKGSSRSESLEALRMVERFLGARTSTASGIREIEKERQGRLNEMLEEDFRMRGGSGRAPELSKQDADNILRWMGSEEGRAAKKNFDSHQVREGITKAVIAAGGIADAGKSVSDLYNEFLESEETLADWIDASESTIGVYF